MKKLILLLLIPLLLFGQVKRNPDNALTQYNADDYLSKRIIAQWNGIDNYMSSALTITNRGVSFYIFPTVTNKAIINFGTNLGITYNTSNVITYGSSFANTVTYINGALSTTLVLNKWNHVVCAYDLITPTVLEFGRVSTTYFTGLSNLLRVWKVKPTAAKALSFYNSGNPDYYLPQTADSIVAIYKFDSGHGYQIKDYSSNKLHGTLSGTYAGFWNNRPRYYYQDYTLAHSDISASAGTTTLLKLPANCKFKDVAIATSAFSANVTLSIGKGTGADTSNVMTITNTNVTGTQSAELSNMISSRDEKVIYIKKSAATSAGSITLRFRFEYEREW